jgi:hypothetical protein
MAALVAVAMAAAASFANAQPAAPATHSGTRITFAPTLGPAQFERSITYPVGRETVYSYQYNRGKMAIAVTIHDGGRRAPPGSDNPAIVAHFAEEMQSTERAFRATGLSNVERPAVPSSCSYGSFSFRCVVFSASGQGGRLFSKLLMTGFREHFLKIRIDWSQGGGATVADADQTLQGFVPALLR